MTSKKHALSLMNRYPSIADLAVKGENRLPRVAWQYLETGTGSGNAVLRNREALD